VHLSFAKYFIAAVFLSLQSLSSLSQTFMAAVFFALQSASTLPSLSLQVFLSTGFEGTTGTTGVTG